LQPRLYLSNLLGDIVVAGFNSDGTSWCQAASQVATSLGIDVDAYRGAPDGDLLDSQNEWSQKMGVSADGELSWSDPTVLWPGAPAGSR
jgi:hypothetical protein